MSASSLSTHGCTLPEKKTGDLVTTDMEKVEVLNNSSASVTTGNCSSHSSQDPEPQGKD